MRFGMFASSAFVVCVLGTMASAQDDTGKPTTPGFGGRVFVQPLFRVGSKRRLNLTEEQQKKIGEIEQKYEKEARVLLENFNKAYQQGRGGRNPQVMQKALEDARKARRIRLDYRADAVKLLTEEQKKVAGPALSGRRGFGTADRARWAIIRPTDFSNELGLSLEQEQKIRDLYRAADRTAEGLLSEDQKVKLEELKRENSPFGAFRRPPERRRPGNQFRPREETPPENKRN